MPQKARRDALPHGAETAVAHGRDGVGDELLASRGVVRRKAVDAARPRLLCGKAHDKREVDGDLLLGGERQVLRLRKVGLRESDALDVRTGIWDRQRPVGPFAAFAFDAREHRLLGGEPERQLGVGLDAHHDAVRLPEDLRAESALRVARKPRQVAGIVPEKPHLAAVNEDKLEMREFHRARVEAEVRVDARPHEIMEALPSLDHHEAHLHGTPVALHHRAEVGEHRPPGAYGPVVRSDGLPRAEGVHLRADLLDGALHAFHPSDEDTWNTAVRIAIATKPTAPAMRTMSIGSSALVKAVMLRSMSFW